MMIKDILPLSRVRIDILTELVAEDLMANEIAIKINRSLQSTHNALSDMREVLNKKQNIYSIKKEVRILLEKFLIRNLLEKRLGYKYYYILPYIKKHLNPNEIIFFGSFYKGNATEDSDIDIFIISEEDEEYVRKVSLKLSKTLKKEIQIISVKPQVHLTKFDKYSDLYNSISKDSRMGIKIPLDILEG